MLKQSSLALLVLTNAGKPVFYSQGSEEDVVQYSAVIQAIVSCFDEDKSLEVIQSASTTIAVSVRSPLVLAAIDHQNRSFRQLKAHLALLHAQILSVLTKQQLERHLLNRPGTDLRPLLEGTEVFLKALSHSFERSEPWSWLGALESMEMRRHARGSLNEVLLSARADTSLLYGLVLSHGLLAGVVRPKQHSLHPPDLHLVGSMLFNTTVFSEGEHWVPICFPKFNPNGFLYAYITQLIIDEPNEHVQNEQNEPYLVLVSPDKQSFFEMQQVSQRVRSELDPKIAQSLASPTPKRIKCSQIGVDPICYFVYKSRLLVQFAQSDEEMVPKSVSLTEIKIKFCQIQAQMLDKRQRVSWTSIGESESVLGWYTPAFELYCYATTSDKEQLSSSVKLLVSYIRRHESRIFIVDGASF